MKGIIVLFVLAMFYFVTYTDYTFVNSYRNAVWQSWSVEDNQSVKSYSIDGCTIEILKKKNNSANVFAYNPITGIHHDFFIKDGKLEKEYYFETLLNGNLRRLENGPDVFFNIYMKILPDDEIKSIFKKYYKSYQR